MAETGISENQTKLSEQQSTAGKVLRILAFICLLGVIFHSLITLAYGHSWADIFTDYIKHDIVSLVNGLFYLVIVIRVFNRFLLKGLWQEIEIVTTYMVLIATITCMISQCFIRRYFTALAAISMSVVSLFLPLIATSLFASENPETGAPIVSCISALSVSFFDTILIWLPIFTLASLASCFKNIPRLWRWGAVLIPISLMLTAQFFDVSLRGSFTKGFTSSSEKPADWPDWLIPPEGAFDIDYITNHHDNSQSLNYKTKDPYPAVSTLKYINETLDKAGLVKLEDSLFRSNMYAAGEEKSAIEYHPSSHTKGWNSFNNDLHHASFNFLYTWNAEWISNSDEIISVWLNYQCAESGTEDLDTLNVSIDFQPPVGHYKKLIENYKKAHTQHAE
ncbi:MAG: hypothetical protein JW860_01940 [Sedimentisphaerales bacterium]|nr:hypothetical protein [Sedimentisphaerales bacterium]